MLYRPNSRGLRWQTFDLEKVQIRTISIFGLRRPEMPRHRQQHEPRIEPGPALLSPSRFAPANRRRLSPPALRTFLSIADLWGLSEGHRLLALGSPSRSTFHGWAKSAREHGEFMLSADTLTRISAVLGIHQALGILFKDEREGVAWLKRPHASTVFAGSPPISWITNGSQDGLMTVRRFLDAARGGVYMQPNEIDRDFVPYDDSEIVFS
jgi:hypothetical protein